MRSRRVLWLLMIVLTSILRAQISPAATSNRWFGLGTDGPLSVTGTNILNTLRTTANGVAGTLTLSVGSSAGFAAGHEILVWQTQRSGATTYEFAQLAAIRPSNLDLTAPLQRNYSTPGAQAIQVPHHTTVIVEPGGHLAAPAWDGLTGGVLVFRANIRFQVRPGGVVDATGRGFRGSPGLYCTSPNQGEGTPGPGVVANSPNGNGGGAGGDPGGTVPSQGCTNIGAGGGGGGGLPGSPGHIQGGSTHGQGGLAMGDNDFGTLAIAGGGGGAHTSDLRGGFGSSIGGSGGGAVYVTAETITIGGEIRANGTQAQGELGENQTVRRATSGSGGGGAVFLRGREISLGAGQVQALAGLQLVASGPEPFSGGAGGAGRIRIESCGSVAGTTNPAAVVGSFDCVPPTIAINTVTNPVGAVAASAVRVAGSVEPGASVWVSASDESTSTADVAATESAGAWTADIDVRSLSDGEITIRALAIDGSGNIGEAGRATIKDTVAPRITPTIVPPSNGRGWANSVVTATFQCADVGVGVTDCPEPLSFGEGRNAAVSVTVTDGAGNSSSLAVGPINVDLTDPSLSGVTLSNPNDRGWFDAPITVRWSCADSLSGILGSCPADSRLEVEGSDLSLMAAVRDNADNETVATMTGINIDRSLPTIIYEGQEPPANSFGWNNSDVLLRARKVIT